MFAGPYADPTDRPGSGGAVNASGRKPDERELRRARVAEMKAAQERSERRRSRLIILVVALVVLVLAVPATILIINAQRGQEQVAELAAEPIEGQEEVEVPSATHVEGEVPYEEVAPVETDEGTALPPLGGDHDAVWQNCGFYSEPVRNENAVHSLEHGAVWLTYRPDLPADQVTTLERLAQENSYLLVSPYEDLAAPVVATAWGIQLELESVDDERLMPFVVRYLQGEQTPEPGAACEGGVGA